jgi:hypothetical protein
LQGHKKRQGWRIKRFGHINGQGGRHGLAGKNVKNPLHRICHAIGEFAQSDDHGAASLFNNLCSEIIAVWLFSERPQRQFDAVADTNVLG